jgi:hypothetical protein
MLVFTTSSAPVTLRATIQDITALPGDPLYDAYPGDIRNARVDLKVNGVTPSGCAGLTPTLINPLDAKTGTVSCVTSLSSGTASTEYTISVAVSNYYRDTNEVDIGVVEVAQPNGTFITGGGYLVESATAGKYGTPPSGSHMNFGFNVKYNKSGTNPQGHANIIFRWNGHKYQIQSNSIKSFGTALQTSGGAGCAGPPSSTCWGVADFRANASLTDVTNPSSPVAVASSGGPMTLQMSLTDKGEPGSADMIAVTLWDGDGTTLLFSSNWSAGATATQLLGGGNLVVH